MIWFVALAAGAVLAWAIYPGELSWLPGKGNQWLYNLAAPRYHLKWSRHDYRPYDALIAGAAEDIVKLSPTPWVADLACGTGRATQVAAGKLGSDARYSAVDFAPAMLEVFRQRIESDPLLQRCDVGLHCARIPDWLLQQGPFELVLLMEAAEFVPDNDALLMAVGRATQARGTLITTRPAGLWSTLFPGRGQSRARQRDALQAAGFDSIEFVPWRARYELVRAIKKA